MASEAVFVLNVWPSAFSSQYVHLQDKFFRWIGLSWKTAILLASFLLFSATLPTKSYAVNEPISGWCQFKGDNSVGLSHASAALDCADACTVDYVTSRGNPVSRECTVVGGNPSKSLSGLFYSQNVAHDFKLVTTETLPSGSTAVVTVTQNYFTSSQKFCVTGEIQDGIFCVTCPSGQEWDATNSECIASSKNDPSCPVAPGSNPISLTTGNKHQIEIDIPASSPNGISFQRSYSSSAIYGLATAFNGYWRHNYELNIVIRGVNDDKAYLTRANGRRLEFDKAGGIWASSLGGAGTLQETLDGNNVTTGWIYTSQDNRTETYDAQGFVTSIADITGYTLTFDYALDIASGGDDFAYSLDRISDSAGNMLLFSYVGNRLARVTDSSGNTYAYGYDASGRLATVTFPDTTQRVYHYEKTSFPQALTGITDERGVRYATFEYDAQGRATASYHGVQTAILTDRIDGVSIAYNDADGSRIITSSNGGASTYSTDIQLDITLVADVSGPGCTICGSGNAAYTNDPANNNLLNKTENSLTTTYGNYDTRGQYGYKIEAVGTPEERRTDYTYDSRFYNKITTITEPSVFPGSNKVTTRSFDAYGNQTLETITGFDVSGTPVSRTTTWQYTGPLNQLSQIDGPRTDVADITTYRYYPNDTSVPVGSRARLREVQDASGVLIRSNIQYTATGKVLSEQRPNGLSLGYTYYPGNDRLQTLTETGAGSTRVTRWTYLATGEVQSIITADGTPDATVLTFGYDDARRLTDITDGLGNFIHYTLDTEGNRTREATCAAGGGATCADADPALTRLITQTFDIYNRLDTTAQGDPLNPLETTNPTFAPDGTLDLSTDGNNTVTDYSYDALKRLTRVQQDVGGTDPTTADATTGYDYDVADRLTQVTDPVNGNTTYAYDDLGNLTTQTSPDTGTTSFQYDAAGNLTNKTDANGQTFTYSYDALNRLTTLDAPGTTDDISYTYDTCTNGSGRLCAVTYGDPNAGFPATNIARYQYNTFGDITQHQGLLYGHDAQGRVISLDYPSGSRVTTQYDAAGQISQLDFQINGQTRTLASNLGYAPFGPLTNLSFGNGLTLIQTLDSAYRLTGQTTTGVLERSYPQYDGNGNRQSTLDALGADSSFTYDLLSRLNTANGPFGTRDYDHDKNGNRTQDLTDGVTTALAYEPNSNRLDTLGATDILLDANGNTLSQGNWTYTWNPHNRLASATENATLKASFRYNGLGQRINKTNETTQTGEYVLYGQNGERLVETDANGNVLMEYIYLNGQRLAIYMPDDDQDGIPNTQEVQGTLPANPDSDGDGLTNLSEWFQSGTDSQNPDSDGDGVLDGAEIAQGTDPNLSSSFPGDGDINENGETNLGDLVLLYQFVMGNRVPTATELTHGDMNQDGQLTVADILLLQRQILQAWLGIETGTALAKANHRRPAIAATTSKNQTTSAALDWFITPAQALPNNNGLLYYVHNDPLGTPQALTDESGATVWTASYDPFGKAMVNEDTDGDGNSITFNARMPGQYEDLETGLHYNYQRYYDPNTGRYLTSDPLGLQAGTNTYLYGEGNPIMNIDPLGLITCS